MESGQPVYDDPIPSKERQNVVADLLEAHLGGLVLEGARYGGTDLARDWIRSLFTTGVFPTLDKDVTDFMSSVRLKMATDTAGAARRKRKADEAADGA